MAKTVRKEERFDRELDPKVAARRNALFNKYIAPYKDLIYWCCIKYSDESCNVEENYTLSLTNLFRGIETYDPTRSIVTWIHFVTKRYVMNINKSRYEQRKSRDVGKDVGYTAMEDVLDDDEVKWNTMNEENYESLYNDDILAALNDMKPIYRDALILQQAGYSLVEIAEIEHAKGTLCSRNIETVKSRLFLARQYMKQKITRDGKRKTD